VVKSRVIPGAEPFRFDAGPVGALLIHGFSGSPASMRPLGEWLSQHGISTAGPRLPGHGTSWEDLDATLWTDWEREAEGALDDLSSRCRDVILVGLSVGGAMALHLAAKRPDRIRGAVVINAMIHRPELVLAPAIRLFTKTIKGVGNDIKRPGQDEIVYDRISVRSVGQLRKLLRTADSELSAVSVPLIVFSSSEDHTVKPANSKRVYERAGSAQKELIPLRNSYHVATLDYDADLIFERVLEFALAVGKHPSSESA
jgi:carboxylesterase